MTYRNIASHPNPPTPQSNTCRHRILKIAATMLAGTALVLDLTSEHHVAAAIRCAAMGVRILNTALDARFANRPNCGADVHAEDRSGGPRPSAPGAQPDRWSSDRLGPA
ncbi:hypothetical protein ACWIGW_39990 [Nocardia brasiliensis]